MRANLDVLQTPDHGDVPGVPVHPDPELNLQTLQRSLQQASRHYWLHFGLTLLLRHDNVEQPGREAVEANK